jgi:mannose/fructose/N-acetylgalactosamine-specific phosphotransferase system component IIB
MDADDADDDSEESDEEAEEDIEVKDMEVDDLKDLIRDIIAQEMGADSEGEEMPGEELPADDMVGAEDEEEIDLDELLKEIAEMDDEHKNEAMSHDDNHKDEAMDHDKKDEGMDHDKKDEAMHSDDHKDESMINEVDPITVAAGVAAVFGGSALTVKLMDDAEAGKYGEKGKKIAAHFRAMGKAAGDAAQHRREDVEISEEDVTEYVEYTGNDNALKDAIMLVAKHAKKAGSDAASKFKDAVKGIEVGSMGDAMSKEEVEETIELEEAMDTVEQLKGQLQEVNLLNAKLLYVNKVFKANNLTESQKVNVIAAFDKAETVKEVKLVFETVADNVVSKSTKSTIRESKLGMASKATGTTASKPEVIAEVSDAVLRMQKLAGIIK